ncbi:MAG: modified peptide precursor CbpA [Candidatus Humimicrobiaceae bacterium]
MKKMSQETSEKKEIIGFRKTCKAKGTGLSHYILVDSSKK